MEEMILAAYSRGIASIETRLPHCSMAAVGFSYKDIKDLCPANIDVSCHNKSENSTICGPAESVKVFVKKLQVRFKSIMIDLKPMKKIVWSDFFLR